MSFKRSTTKTTNSSKSSNIVHIDRISGIKPWINGQYFVSFGLRQLDELFGGGNALGTLCVLEEDQYSNHGTILFNYNIAEALSHGHPILMVGFDKKTITDRLEQLPYNLNYKNNDVVTDIKTNKDQHVYIDHLIDIDSDIDTSKSTLVDNMISMNVASDPDTPPIHPIPPTPPVPPAIVHSKELTGVVYCNSYDLSRK